MKAYDKAFFVVEANKYKPPSKLRLQKLVVSLLTLLMKTIVTKYHGSTKEFRCPPLDFGILTLLSSISPGKSYPLHPLFIDPGGDYKYDQVKTKILNTLIRLKQTKLKKF